MERLRHLITASLRQPPNRRLHSEIHVLADEISSFFGERRLFARYLGVIKRIGVTKARTIFSEVKQSGAREPHKLFFWKCRQNGRKAGPKRRPAKDGDGAERTVKS